MNPLNPNHFPFMQSFFHNRRPWNGASKNRIAFPGSCGPLVFILASLLLVSGCMAGKLYAQAVQVQTPKFLSIWVMPDGLELRWQVQVTPDLQMFEVERVDSEGGSRSFTLNPFKLRQEQTAGKPDTTFIWLDKLTVPGITYLYRIRSHSEDDNTTPSQKLSAMIPKKEPPKPVLKFSDEP